VSSVVILERIAALHAPVSRRKVHPVRPPREPNLLENLRRGTDGTSHAREGVCGLQASIRFSGFDRLPTCEFFLTSSSFSSGRVHSMDCRVTVAFENENNEQPETEVDKKSGSSTSKGQKAAADHFNSRDPFAGSDLIDGCAGGTLAALRLRFRKVSAAARSPSRPAIRRPNRSLPFRIVLFPHPSSSRTR